jgi:hypothetical protein
METIHMRPIHMRPFKRKSRLQRLLTTVKQIDLPGRPSDKAVKASLIAAGGLTGLTAGSAGISSLRRRSEGAEDDS